MSLISAHNIVKRYGDRTVLDEVSVTIEPDDRVGLIGRNGAGKSTLISILMDRTSEDAGEIMRRRGLTTAWVEQSPEFDPALTIEQTLQTGLAGHQAQKQTLARLEEQMSSATGDELAELIQTQAAVLERLDRMGGFDLSHRQEAMRDRLRLPHATRSVGTLSLGERRRLSIAIGLLQAPELLVLDEPTNHLDFDTIAWLESTLGQYRGALLLVTHDRYFLDNIATRMAELDRGKLTVYSGNYSDFLVSKAIRSDIEDRTENRRQRAIESELQWVRKSAPARTTKQKARLDRFDALVAARPAAKVGDAQFRIPHPPRIGKTILEIRGACKAFDGHTLFNNFDLTLSKGVRIGIVGDNGAGKTTLVRAVLGEVELDAGHIERGSNTKVVYADQGRVDLTEENTVIEELAGKNDTVFVGERPVSVYTFLSQLLFDDATQRTKISALSGGERSRVALAKALSLAGNLLILDEPTNDLDLATLRVLEDALLAYPGCVLAISHDRYFLDRISTNTLAFVGDGKLELHAGNYSEFIARSAKRPKPEGTPRPKKEAAAQPQTKARTRRTFKEEREFQGMEALILDLESDLETRTQELSDPEFIRKHGAELARKSAELDTLRKRIEAAYARWASLDGLSGYGT